MLEIDVKLIPFGIKDREQIISKLTIWNDGTGDHEIGNYGYKIISDKAKKRKGSLKNFHRREGVLKLLQLVLEDAL